MVIHLELAGRDIVPFGSWIQLVDQKLRIYVNIPLPGLYLLVKTL